MNRKKNKKIDRLVILTLILGLIILAFRRDLIYSFWGEKYSIAYDFQYESTPKNVGNFGYKYLFDGKVYTSTIGIGKNLRYGGPSVTRKSFKPTDKYLVEVPMIAKGEGRILRNYRLPDTTSTSSGTLDSIPEWILNLE